MESLELLQWVYVAVIAPLFGAIGGWLRDWWVKRATAKRQRTRIIRDLSGLPPEAKAVLLEFYREGAHTRRDNPGDPAVRLLINSGVLVEGPGGGTYDAVDRYLAIKAPIWEAIPAWIAKDSESVARVFIEFFEATDARNA